MEKPSLGGAAFLVFLVGMTLTAWAVGRTLPDPREASFKRERLCVRAGGVAVKDTAGRVFDCVSRTATVIGWDIER